MERGTCCTHCRMPAERLTVCSGAFMSALLAAFRPQTAAGTHGRSGKKARKTRKRKTRKTRRRTSRAALNCGEGWGASSELSGEGRGRMSVAKHVMSWSETLKRDRRAEILPPSMNPITGNKSCAVRMSDVSACGRPYGGRRTSQVDTTFYVKRAADIIVHIACLMAVSDTLMQKGETLTDMRSEPAQRKTGNLEHESKGATRSLLL